MASSLQVSCCADDCSLISDKQTDSQTDSQTDRQIDRQTDSVVCDLQVDLAVKLGLPLLAPHPSIARHFSLKSGAKQLFRSAKVNVAPGVELDPRPPGPAQAFGQSLSTSHPAPPPSHPSLHLLHFHYLPFPAQSLHFASLKPVSQHKTHVSLCTAFNCLNWLAGYIACLA